MAQDKVIPNLFWAVFGKGGFIHYSTIRPTRREAINAFLKYSTATWQKARKNGFTCEKIEISKKLNP